MQFAGAFTQFNAFHLSMDWIILGVVALVIALDAIRAGSARAASIALALPASLLLYQALPRASYIGSVVTSMTASSTSLQALAFGVLFILSYFLIARMLSTYGDDGGLLKGIIAGVAAAVVLVVVWTQLPMLCLLWNFGQPITRIFTGGYRFWWLLGAYVALAFARS